MAPASKRLLGGMTGLQVQFHSKAIITSLSFTGAGMKSARLHFTFDGSGAVDFS
jgi:hypothetical protein